MFDEKYISDNEYCHSDVYCDGCDNRISLSAARKAIKAIKDGEEE